VLKRLAERPMRIVRHRAKKRGKTEHLYGECRYGAKSWGKKWRIIYKAEVVRHEEREPKSKLKASILIRTTGCNASTQGCL